jgi:hypothetical protein
VNFQYNFRLGPEAAFLILSAVGGAILTELVTVEYTAITDWRAYAWSFGGMLLFRTIPAAILAVVTGGGFQKPGEPKEPIGPVSG